MPADNILNKHARTQRTLGTRLSEDEKHVSPGRIDIDYYVPNNRTYVHRGARKDFAASAECLQRSILFRLRSKKRLQESGKSDSLGTGMLVQNQKEGRTQV